MKLFATRVWGFDPLNWPAIVFNHEGDRNNLIRVANPGDRIIFVATKGDEPRPEERGRILGIAEIGSTAVDTLQLVKPEAVASHERDERGNIRWPKAIPMLRAWRFPEKPLLTDILREQLTYSATIRAVLLDEEDARSVLALTAVEVELPESEVLRKERTFSANLMAAQMPTRGPPPADWTRTVTHVTAVSAYTYAFRFGSHDVWKIGWTDDVAARLAEVNSHIPYEVTGERWSRELENRHMDENAAYEMEQRLLVILSKHRTVGERVQCTLTDMKSAWVSAFRG